MKQTGSLTVTTASERAIVMTRTFNAPRALVFDGLTKPEILKRWFFGPPAWTLTTCEIDLRAGGRYRYVWRKGTGVEMGMSGEFREVLPPIRIVQTEKFDESWYPGEALATTVLEENGGKTTLILTVEYESAEARDAVLKTPMDDGVAAAYDRLAELLQTEISRSAAR
jgi:uncharacterized protein YndB with AHSA1/START domain